MIIFFNRNIDQIIFFRCRQWEGGISSHLARLRQCSSLVLFNSRDTRLFHTGGALVCLRLAEKMAARSGFQPATPGGGGAPLGPGPPVAGAGPGMGPGTPSGRMGPGGPQNHMYRSPMPGYPVRREENKEAAEPKRRGFVLMFAMLDSCVYSMHQTFWIFWN